MLEHLRRILFLTFFYAVIATASAQVVSIPSTPLRNTEDLDTLIRAIGNARIVLLGEASHGTSEYYLWRTAITRRLIREKGFNCIAVEGEWADCYKVNQWLKSPGGDSAAITALLQGFNRWPTWMWANEETRLLLQWLYSENRGRPPRKGVGFYGLDLYCLWESLEALAASPDPDTALRRDIQAAYRCFAPFGADAANYARAVKNGHKGCHKEAERLRARLKTTPATSAIAENRFAQEQYALVLSNGERFFRNISSGAAAWNIRENHFLATISRLLAFHGPDARIIVWAHNTHVGDARASAMSTRNKLSLGQLLRQAYGDTAVFITGLGSYSGTVLCGKHWGDTMRFVDLPPARAGSWEDLLHKEYGSNRLIFCRTFRKKPGLNGYYSTRAIGVVYQPESDAYSSYTPSMMARRYDAFIFFDTTSALHPLQVKTDPERTPYLFPTGR